MVKVPGCQDSKWQAVAVDLDIEWSGPATDGIGSFGTALAFLVVAFAYVGSVRDKRREQARRISAWIQASDSSAAPRELHILNGSEQPVFDLRVSAGGEAEPRVPQVLPPGSPV